MPRPHPIRDCPRARSFKERERRRFAGRTRRWDGRKNEYQSQGSRRVRKREGSCRKVYVSRENYRISEYAEMFYFKKRAIPPCKTQSYSTILSLFDNDSPAIWNTIFSPYIPHSVLAFDERAGKRNSIKPIFSCFFRILISKQGLDII